MIDGSSMGRHWLAIGLVLCCGPLRAQVREPARPLEPASAVPLCSGDIGAGLNFNRVAQAAHAQPASPVPYLNGECGSLFARVDSFGANLWPLGNGQLEFSTRVVGDGYQPADGTLARRRESVPLGLSTLQVTPYGALLASLHQDVNASHGRLGSLLYAAEFPLGPASFYPQLGLEYRNGRYLRYYDGTSAYRPGGASSPFIALFAEVHLRQRWYFNLNLRKSWQGPSIRNSPLVVHTSPTTALAAISYRFNTD